MTEEHNWMPGQSPSSESVASPSEAEKPKRKLVTITEAAQINNVTRQAIYVAIKQKKLKATKIASRWVIDLDHLGEYRNSKYSRSKSTYEGELLFDNTKGYYSINQVAKMLNVPAQKIYYATRVGHMTAKRKGAAWVIHIDDVKQYKEKYLNARNPFDQEFVG